MVFFGLRTSSDQQITRMQEEIVKLAELREIKRQNRLSLLQRELDFSMLAARVGSTLAQSIMSSQYVMGCIAVYFRREWIDYYLNTFAPIIELYQQIPDAATKAKFQLARRFSFAQRLTAVTLATTIVCARSASPSFSGAVITAGRVLGSFGALSFLTLPELGQNITRSFDSFMGASKSGYNISMQVNKYDRQIRLWGQKGQRRLGEARVALLGASGAGVEAIKNLVLPGVGHIDIWAEGTVDISDLSSTFFYSPEDVGKNKAEILLENLLEMNPDDVKGQAYVRSPAELLKDQQKLKDYSLLICSDLRQSLNREISSLCYQLNIPVVFITVVGFYIYIRNQQKLHIVQSENTTSKKYYMRLQDPFPALKKHSNQWNIADMVAQLGKIEDKEERLAILNAIRFIPYPIILLQVFEQLPADLKSQTHNFKAQQEIKRLVLEKIKEYSLIIGEDHRENFTEAGNRTLDLFQTVDNFLPDITLLDSPYVLEANKDSSHALQFLLACRAFYQRHNGLPQTTKLPDMHTSTQQYLQLKQIYRHQHEIDIAELQAILSETINSNLSSQEISDFIDNVDALKIIELGEYNKELQKVDNPNLQWEAPEWRNILLALRAYKLFEEKENRPPTPQDFLSMQELANSLRRQYGFQQLQDLRYLKQICRAQGQTTISLNSIAGAISGQESIKLITQCFTPVKSGYLFSGIHSVGYSVSL